MQHYRTVDPEKEWAVGLVGRLARLRILVPAVSLDVMVSALLAFYKELQYAGIALAIGAGIAAVGFTLRYYLLKGIKLEKCLHAFAHEARDQISRIDLCAAPSERALLVEQFNDLAANHVADYFRTRGNSTDYGAAIRLAEKVEGHEVYVTKARHGLDPCREDSSEPLPSNEGLAWALREKETQGVYIVPDVQKAATEFGWKQMKNDVLPDVSTVMAAPINGWDSGQKSMFGILFVTSASRTFYPAETEALKMFADALGMYYAAIWAKMSSTV